MVDILIEGMVKRLPQVIRVQSKKQISSSFVINPSQWEEDNGNNTFTETVEPTGISTLLGLFVNIAPQSMVGGASSFTKPQVVVLFDGQIVATYNLSPVSDPTLAPFLVNEFIPINKEIFLNGKHTMGIKAFVSNQPAPGGVSWNAYFKIEAIWIST